MFATSIASLRATDAAAMIWCRSSLEAARFSCASASARFRSLASFQAVATLLISSGDSRQRSVSRASTCSVWGPKIALIRRSVPFCYELIGAAGHGFDGDVLGEPCPGECVAGAFPPRLGGRV